MLDPMYADAEGERMSLNDLRADDETSSLADLMLAAPPISPGCRHATVP